MALFSDDDLDALLDGFGIDVTYTPDGGSPAPIRIIFYDETIVIDPNTGESQKVAPSGLTKTSNVPNAKNKETLVINSATYEILTAAPDNNTGATELVFNKTS